MSGPVLLFLVLGLGLIAWLTGRARAVRIRQASGSRRFSSLPGHHGWFVALWTVLPPIVFLVVWAFTSPAMVTNAVLHAPSALQLPPPGFERAAILSPDSYAAGQSFARARRGDGSDGIVYPSVRHASGGCVAAFWPDVVGVPVQERHLQYEWNGAAMTRYFDYQRDDWFPLPDNA